jgi:hypothetical protein
MIDKSTSLQEAVEVFNITVFSLFRAKKERPRILNTTEKTKLIQAIVDTNITRKPLTHKRLRNISQTIFFQFKSINNRNLAFSLPKFDAYFLK